MVVKKHPLYINLSSRYAARGTGLVGSSLSTGSLKAMADHGQEAAGEVRVCAPEHLFSWISFRSAGHGPGAGYGAGGICTCTQNLLWEVLVVLNFNTSGWSRGFARRCIIKQTSLLLCLLCTLLMFLVKSLWKTGREISGFSGRNGGLEHCTEKLMSPAV